MDSDKVVMGLVTLETMNKEIEANKAKLAEVDEYNDAVEAHNAGLEVDEGKGPRKPKAARKR